MLQLELNKRKEKFNGYAMFFGLYLGRFFKAVQFLFDVKIELHLTISIEEGLSF